MAQHLALAENNGVNMGRVRETLLFVILAAVLPVGLLVLVFGLFWAGMNIKQIFVAAMLLAWAAAVLWGAAQIALSARRREMWPPSLYVGGMIGSCALGAGIALFIENSLPFNTVALGFLLAAGGGLTIWALGNGLRYG
jgi:drug/metabolite transporter (DMT)-like permease